MTNDRKIKGVWIPIEIWENEKLSITEKVIITEIDSFSNSDIGCFISNNHFAKFTGLSASRCSTIINELSKKGFIDIELIRDSNTGHVKKRYLKLSNSLLSEMKTPISETKGGISETKLASFGNSESTNTLILTNTININNNKHMSDFEEFYKKYPRKVQKKKAEQKFNNVVKDKETFDKIMEDLEKRKYFEQWIKNDGKFIPHPTTYLNGELWNDEYPTISINENKKGVSNEFGSVESKD